MLTHAFEKWRCYRVALQTDARNTQSRAAIERLGATLGGVLRAHKLPPTGPSATARSSPSSAASGRRPAAGSWSACAGGSATRPEPRHDRRLARQPGARPWATANGTYPPNCEARRRFESAGSVHSTRSVSPWWLNAPRRSREVRPRRRRRAPGSPSASRRRWSRQAEGPASDPTVATRAARQPARRRAPPRPGRQGPPPRRLGTVDRRAPGSGSKRGSWRCCEKSGRSGTRRAR